ncbi:MAG: hypothetical protein R3A79_31210 [Nannocystaceae bacterium]
MKKSQLMTVLLCGATLSGCLELGGSWGATATEVTVGAATADATGTTQCADDACDSLDPYDSYDADDGPWCSDGQFEPERGEACDDGNWENGDGCDELCELECGNSRVEGEEMCDDGNDVDDDACNNSCRRNPCQMGAALVVSGLAENDHFGSAVAVADDVLVVGARADSATSGAAYVCENIDGEWLYTGRLVASDTAAGDSFGAAVGVSGYVIVVGAPRSSAQATGAAYVFERTGGAWVEVARLEGGEGALGDRFGESVALDGFTAVIGAPHADGEGAERGAAYVFERSGGAWSNVAELWASDSVDFAHAGTAVAVEDGLIFVGAPGDSSGGQTLSGAAYVYAGSGAKWQEVTKLGAADPTQGAGFGSSVAVLGDTAVLGAPGESSQGLASGAAYVFDKFADAWTQSAKIVAEDGAAGDEFGAAVSGAGDMLVFGAPGDDPSRAPEIEDAGSTAVFVREGGVWTPAMHLLSPEVGLSDRFGGAVAYDGGALLVGAELASGSQASLGAAYLFSP